MNEQPLTPTERRQEKNRTWAFLEAVQVPTPAKPEPSPLHQATERARDELALEVNHWQDRQGTPAAAAILNIETAVLNALDSALAHPEQLENTIGLIYDALGDARISMNRAGLEQAYREVTDAKLRAYIDSEPTR